MNPKLSIGDVIVQDFWVHFAGLIAIAVGLADLWYFHQFAHDTELLLIVGGFAGMGLKIVNGSAAQLRQAALDTAFAAMRAAQTAAAAAATTTPAPTTPTPAAGSPVVTP